MAILTIVRPGLLTTIQDLGRWGWQGRGVPVAGAMDLVSHRLANSLVGNAAGAATLEITLSGPEVQIDDDRVAAVAGAAFSLRVNGAPVSSNVPFQIPGGGTLTFGTRNLGCRAYLAIAGGVDVPMVLGSRSTHLPSRMGGLDGRALLKGDRLPVGVPSSRLASDFNGVTSGFRRKNPTSSPPLVRVLPGPHHDRFDDNALKGLVSSPYRVGTDSNRMGFRLEGPRLAHRGPAEIITEAMPLGALQVPASGEPILLMADHQTTGGYPVLATVIGADLDVAAQLAPGDLVQFATCSLEEAIAALRACERELSVIENRADDGFR